MIGMDKVTDEYDASGRRDLGNSFKIKILSFLNEGDGEGLGGGVD